MMMMMMIMCLVDRKRLSKHHSSIFMDVGDRPVHGKVLKK